MKPGEGRGENSWGAQTVPATRWGQRQLVQTKDWMCVGRWSPVHRGGTRELEAGAPDTCPSHLFFLLLRPELTGRKIKIQDRSFIRFWFPLFFTFIFSQNKEAEQTAVSFFFFYISVKTAALWCIWSILHVESSTRKDLRQRNVISSYLWDDLQVGNSQSPDVLSLVTMQHNIRCLYLKLISLCYYSALGNYAVWKAGKDDEASILNKLVPRCSCHVILPGLTHVGFVCD